MPATLLQTIQSCSPERCGRCVLLACAGLLLLSTAGCVKSGANAGVWEGEEAVDWLGAAVAEQEAHLARITSLSFSVTERGMRREGRRVHERKMDHREFEKGAWIRIERSGTIPENLGRGRRRSVFRTESLVLNDRYLAQAHPPSTVAYLREHSSIDAMPQQSRDALHAFDAQGPRRHGFGNGHDSLVQIHRTAQTQKYFELRVERVPGPERLFSLKCSHRKSPMFEMTLDGDRGYLVLETSHYGPGGFLSEKIAVTPGEIAPGLWFPREWTRTTYDPIESKPGVSYPVQTTFNDITSIEINPELDDALFTWQTMPLGPAVEISRYDAAGEFQTFDIVHGELVPQRTEETPRTAETADAQPRRPPRHEAPQPPFRLGTPDSEEEVLSEMPVFP